MSPNTTPSAAITMLSRAASCAFGPADAGDRASSDVVVYC
jgi:hypothetical protein